MIGVVAAAPVSTMPDLTRINNKNRNIRWFGVDRGVITLLNAGIKCELGIGDFDSVTKEEWGNLKKSGIALKRYPQEKNETDLELALDLLFAEVKNEDIYVYGVTGGRIDHQYATIMLLLKYDQTNRIYVVDKQNILTVIRPGNYKFIKNNYKYLSIIPLSAKVENITLQGFRYNICAGSFYREKTLGISNEISAEEGHISFEKGICLVVRSNDFEECTL